MASHITHYYTAVQVQNTAVGQLKNIIDKYTDSFLLGAQGADLLFYAFGKNKGYAGRTHKEKIFEQFRHCVAYCSLIKDENTLAYLLGFACHYCLDKNSHSYIIHEANTRLANFYPPHLQKCYHMMLEARIDYYICCEKLKQPLRTAIKKALVVSKNATKAMADIFFYAINPLFKEDMSYELLCKLPSRMLSYQSIFSQPHSFKYKALKFASKLLGNPNYITGFFPPSSLEQEKDLLNNEHRPYPVYIGAKTTLSLSFEEIMSLSQRQTVELCNHILDCYDNNTELSDKYFDIAFSGDKAQ